MANKKTLSIGALIVVVVAAVLGIDLNQNVSNTSHTTASSTEAEKLQQPNAGENTDSSEQMSTSASNGLQTIREAFDQQRSDIQVLAWLPSFSSVSEAGLIIFCYVTSQDCFPQLVLPEVR